MTPKMIITYVIQNFALISNIIFKTSNFKFKYSIFIVKVWILPNRVVRKTGTSFRWKTSCVGHKFSRKLRTIDLCTGNSERELLVSVQIHVKWQVKFVLLNKRCNKLWELFCACGDQYLTCKNDPHLNTFAKEEEHCMAGHRRMDGDMVRGQVKGQEDLIMKGKHCCG